jgi:hypothetical protein
LRNRVQEVIPMSRKAYRGVRVDDVDAHVLGQQRPGDVVVGVDVGKLDLRVVVRWADGEFERPWRVINPHEIVSFEGPGKKSALPVPKDRPGIPKKCL